ncbi:hypothetical protein B0H14DRAFT_2607646 [Mycena olivaceomarginata]|nr:hypothetical protein B0H14DRAFT_2607646 [Mycena olivaceomarginata]
MQVPSVTLHAEFSTWTHSLLSQTGLRVLGICEKLLPTLPFSPAHIPPFAITAKRKDKKSLSLSSKAESILRTDAYLEIQGTKFERQPGGQTRSSLLHNHVKELSPALMDIDLPNSGSSLLTQLMIPGEGPSSSMQDNQQGETLFKRMAMSLEERLGLPGDAGKTLKGKKRRGRPPKAIREHLDAERHEHGGAL